MLLGALMALRLEGAENILIFAGQSNMGGKGTANTDLPADLAGDVPNVVGFYCNAWDTAGGEPEPFGMDLYPGGRFRFDWATVRREDGTYLAGGTWQPYSYWKQQWVGTSRTGSFTYVKGDRSMVFWHIGLNPGEPWANAAAFHSGEPVRQYGPELTAVHAIHAARPDSLFGVVKYAPGGTSLAKDWNPNDPAGCYAAMKDWVNCALASRPGAKVAGFFWLQGESDALNQRHASDYQANMERMIKRLRADFSAPDLPVIIAKIHPGDAERNYGYVFCGNSDGINAVRAAQDAVAAGDPQRVRTVETSDLILLHKEWNQWKAHHPVQAPHHKDDASHDDVMTGSYVAPLHFDSAGIQEIGWRMGKAWLTLLADSK
jgi:hypothetical protein